MRPKGVIGLFIIVLVIGLILFLIDDQLIERGLEKAGTSVVGAKVEIDQLDLDLLGLGISLNRLQVTNPGDTWKNLFETGRMAFNLQTWPLLRKKVIIDEVALLDVRIGTKRETDGRIPKVVSGAGARQPSWLEKAVSSLKDQVAAAPVLQLGTLKQKINVDSLLAIAHLRTPGRIALAQAQADSSFQKWQKIMVEFDPGKDLQRVEKQIKQLKSRQIKGLDDLVAAASTVNTLHKTLKELKTDLDAKKRLATDEFKQVSQSLTRVDNWVEEDFNSLIGMAHLADFSPRNVARMLFGKAIVLPTIGLLRYVGVARQYMPVARQFLQAGKVEKPRRFHGQNIRFPLTYPLPDFLIRRIEVSGASNQADTSKVWFVQGLVQGITSHPKVYGKPLTLELRVEKPASDPYLVTGVLDHTGEIPEDRIQIKGFGVKVGSWALAQQPYLPERVEAERGDLSADFKLIGDTLDFRLNFAARPVRFQFADDGSKSDMISDIMHKVFGSIAELKISAGVQGRVESPKLQISSNVDNILAQRLKEVVGASIKRAHAEIRTRLNALVTPKKQEALAFLNKRQSQILSEIGKYENRINDKMAFLEKKKKELEARIAKEKKKGLEGVKKKLKKIFN